MNADKNVPGSKADGLRRLLAHPCSSLFIGVAAFLTVPNPAQSAAVTEPPPGASACSGCHATDPSVATPVPNLIGRKPDEIVSAVAAFRSGQRPATVMDRIAKGFTDAEIRAIAEWYGAKQP